MAMKKKPRRHQDIRRYDVHRTLSTHPHRVAAEEPDYSTAEEVQDETKRRSWWRRLFYLFLILLLLGVGLVGWDIYNFSNASQKMFGSGNLFQLAGTSSLKGEDSGRVNVLVVGYSADDPGHQGANLTDSIILLSMNTSNHSGYMLSIPRDLYVKIPGHGYGKINEAYEDGGMDTLEQIVSTNFGTPLDYYMLVNYGSVRGIVNALGGITVNIQSPDPRGLYDPNISPADGGPLKLANGPQKLDGQTALNLTRARGDAYGAYGFPRSDFDRTMHQRQVFMAIKDQARWGLVLNPLKNRQLFNAVGSNIKTDVQLAEVRRLYSLFNGIPNSNLQSVSLNSINGRNLLTGYSSYGAGSALIPAAGLSDYSNIQAAIDQLNQ